ncbi:MAG: L-histidine N(alpha)-methyltransferase [Planctomycetota bacterium]|nr:MAG: L-histidine N(alpha)-methyltransferase [Planctomycetota bacterium]REK38564.1 MAG: L-histidine N(alpha)-methyltransferase [Planctomycetota bacterium]
MPAFRTATQLLDFEPTSSEFLEEVITGLGRAPKSLPCKFFYDERGSHLFEQICELEEYYPTRTELGIMRRYAGEMAEQIGPGVMLVEYGSGSSTKTTLLLDRLEGPVAYVPVDISGEHLHQTAESLARRYPEIEILPVCADFTGEFELPVSRRTPTHKAVYFPGSTIGNLTPDLAERMLRRIVEKCGCGGGLLIGVDLQKDIATIEAAYNDARGVTAEFNLNLLHRINEELGGNIDVDRFEHRAKYNRELHRVEIDLVSLCEQTVEVGDASFDFSAGEKICTEHSHKYTIDGFADLAARAGLELHRAWTDERDYFAVLHFAVAEAEQ